MCGFCGVTFPEEILTTIYTSQTEHQESSPATSSWQPVDVKGTFWGAHVIQKILLQHGDYSETGSLAVPKSSSSEAIVYCSCNLGRGPCEL